LALDLLFDVTLAGSTLKTNDVRSLTGPLWDLAENQPGELGAARPPLVRFIWGKYWNIPGVITAIAQRLEYFAEDGAPRRSWVRLRMLRTSESLAVPQTQPAAVNPLDLVPAPPSDLAPPEIGVETIGGGETMAAVEEGPVAGQPGERLDQIADTYFGDPAWWRLIAVFNGISDPLRMAAGTLLRIPNTVTRGDK